MEWLESLILGAVQGVTEFLPVSSDGHLAITQQAFAWLTGRSRSGQEDLFFDIMLHVGTLVAILLYYRNAIWQGARGFLPNATDVPPAAQHSASPRLRWAGRSERSLRVQTRRASHHRTAPGTSRAACRRS